MSLLLPKKVANAVGGEGLKAFEKKAGAKERGPLSDRGFNDNGVRRHAMTIRVDRSLVGVLALIQDEKFPGQISKADAILDELGKMGAIVRTGSFSSCRSSAPVVVVEPLCRLAASGADRSNGPRPDRAGRLQQRQLGKSPRYFNYTRVR